MRGMKRWVPAVLGVIGLAVAAGHWLRDTARGDDEGEGAEAHVRKPLPPAEEIAKLPPDGGDEFNRLVFESSPYLLQHARNPVDWYPWGEAAFEKARREGKPIFLSVGYATCHWCHVMERESFESEEVAAILNERFVAIKVDREERPDVDNVYMAAVLAMNGSGGWPMSVFLLPDRRPFWGGTYFPPEDRLGRPGFKRILDSIAEAWRDRRDEVIDAAASLTRHVGAQLVPTAPAPLKVQTLTAGFDAHSGTFDSVHGGFGHAPKFPRSHALSFLLAYWKRSGDPKALSMTTATLDAMARGGMRDHLGGGFHRYSTDEEWLVPHFEKMLYDQAILARTYLEAYQATGESRHAEVAREILRYLLRDLSDPEGGFHSAEDADSEGVEGKFYVWTAREIREVLGEEDAAIFARAYGVSEGGNFRDESTPETSGANILHQPTSIDGPPELGGHLAGLRERLLDVRERRVRPEKDDKVLTDWNGLAISALACGGRVLDEPRYLDAARRAAAFVAERMKDASGRLLHRYRRGQAGIPAYLDDHAFLVLGLVDLYEATLEPRWLGEALSVAGDLVRLFWDAEGKGFRFSGTDAEALIGSTKEIYDGAVPSGNSAAALALLRLGRLAARPELEAKARETLEVFGGSIEAGPSNYPFALLALDFALGPVREIVVAGDPADPVVRAMLREVHRRYLPRTILAFRPLAKDDAARVARHVPFLAELVPVGGRATAYVCKDYACSLPTGEVEELISLLEEKR